MLILSNSCLTTLIQSQENWSDVKHNMMDISCIVEGLVILMFVSLLIDVHR